MDFDYSQCLDRSYNGMTEKMLNTENSLQKKKWPLFFDCNCLRSPCPRTLSPSRDRVLASGPAGSHLTLATHTHAIAISVQFGAMVPSSAARAPEGSERRIPLSRGVWIWFFAPPQKCKKRSDKKGVKRCEMVWVFRPHKHFLKNPRNLIPFYTILYHFIPFYTFFFRVRFCVFASLAIFFSANASWRVTAFPRRTR